MLFYYNFLNLQETNFQFNMYYNKNPPQEPHQYDFPIVNYNVTVPKCWYYLSLLERFVDTTKDMPENILKIYLVRAEYRYFKWISRGSGNKTMPPSVPPIGKS